MFLLSPSYYLRNQNKAHKSALISYENQLNAAHEQTEELSIDLERKENTLHNLQDQFSGVQNKLTEEMQKVWLS